MVLAGIFLLALVAIIPGPAIAARVFHSQAALLKAQTGATTATTTTAAQIRVIRISLVTKTEERVAAGSPGDQRATMESTVKLRKYLS